MPAKPPEGELSSRFLDVMDDMISLWTRINAAPEPAGVTVPLKLPDGFTLGDVEGEVTDRSS